MTQLPSTDEGHPGHLLDRLIGLCPPRPGLSGLLRVANDFLKGCFRRLGLPPNLVLPYAMYAFQLPD